MNKEIALERIKEENEAIRHHAKNVLNVKEFTFFELAMDEIMHTMSKVGMACMLSGANDIKVYNEILAALNKQQQQVDKFNNDFFSSSKQSPQTPA